MPETNASPLRPVVVLSRNYSTALGVIRSLGSAGYPVDLLASAPKPGASQISAASKYVNHAIEIVARNIKTVYDLELLKEALNYEGRFDEKPVLFPIDDYTANIADSHREELSGIFDMPRIAGEEGNGSMLARMDKSFQARLATEAGLNTPLEWVISLRNSIEIPDDMVYPCFCKPIESISGYKKEMARCDTKEDLTTQLELMRKNSPHRSVLVQEFLQIEQEIDFSGVCNDQEVIVPGIIRKTHIAQHEVGVTMAGTVVPAEELGETLEPVMRFLKSLHYVGMFDMELNLVDGRYYFNEINLRSGGPSFSYFMSGANLPALAVKAIADETWEEKDLPAMTYGKNFVYEKVAWEDYNYGFLTRSELSDVLNEADFGMLINKDDPEPGRIFMRQMRTKEAKTRLKAVRDGIRNAERALEQDAFDRARNARAGQARTIDAKHTESAESARSVESVESAENAVNAESAESAVNAGSTVSAIESSESPSETTEGVNIAGTEAASRAPQPRAMVVGETSANILAAVNALGLAGYDVEVLRIKKKQDSLVRRIPALTPEGASSYVTRYHILFAPKGFKPIIERLAELGDAQNKVPLIPADARCANALNAYYDTLSHYYLLPSLDKRLCGQAAGRDPEFIRTTAREAGIALRANCTLSARAGSYEIPQDINFPCKVKISPVPATTRTYTILCKQLANLEITLRKYARLFDFDAKVTELPKPVASYFIPGFSTGEEVFSPAFIKQTLPAIQDKDAKIADIEEPESEDATDSYKEDSAGEWEVVAASAMEQTHKTLIRFIKELAFEGIFTVKMSELADGSVVFDYLRFYLFPLSEMLLPAGVNPCASFARYLTEGEIDEDLRTCSIQGGTAEPPAHEKAVKRAEDIHAAGKNVRTAKRALDAAALEKTLNAQRYVRAYPQTLGRNRRDPQAEKPRTVVVGRNFCSNLCMAKALGMAGYEVEILRLYQVVPSKGHLVPRLTPEAYSTYVKSFDTFVSHREDRAIAERILEMADPSYKKLLFPADDLSAAIIDEYYDELSQHFVIPNVGNKAGNIMELMSKSRQKELARAAGLPVANGVAIPLIEGAFSIPDSVTYPCFTKPDISKNASKKRMLVCNSREELHNALSRFAKYGNSVMFVEDCLDIAREHSILGVCAGGKAISPAFFSALVGGQNARCGVAVLGQIQDGSEVRELVEACNRFVESLDYTGLFDIDLIETSSGEIIFAEVNLRFGASGYAFTKAGLNLPGMLADYWTYGTPINQDACTPESAYGKTFLSEKVLLEEYASGRITLDEYKELFDAADIRFICDESDPKPGENFQQRAIIVGKAERAKEKIKPARNTARKALKRIKRALS